MCAGTLLFVDGNEDKVLVEDVDIACPLLDPVMHLLMRVTTVQTEHKGQDNHEIHRTRTEHTHAHTHARTHTHTVQGRVLIIILKKKHDTQQLYMYMDSTVIQNSNLPYPH